MDDADQAATIDGSGFGKTHSENIDLIIGHLNQICQILCLRSLKNIFDSLYGEMSKLIVNFDLYMNEPCSRKFSDYNIRIFIVYIIFTILK